MVGDHRGIIYSNGGWSGENIGMFRPQHPNFNFHCHCTVGVLRYLGKLTDMFGGNRNSLRLKRDSELLIVGCVDSE